MARLVATAIGIAAPLPVVVGLAQAGIELPGVQQVVALVALFLVLGLLIARLLRLPSDDGWVQLAFAAGLSIAFLMALGLAVNALHGLGVARPLSPLLIAGAVGIATALLAVVALRHGGLFPGNVSTVKVVDCRTLPFLALLSLVVVGARLVSLRDDNTVLLVALALVAVLPLAAFVPRLLPPGRYPLAIFVAGLVLLLHRSLISSRLTGYDIHVEYYFANLALEQGFWDRGIPHNYNSMLSVVLVPPIFSSTAGVELLWVYKAVYPLVFALVPLALFLAWRDVFGARVAFLGACFFVFTQTFYQAMPHQPRMQMAMLFLALLLLSPLAGGGMQRAALRLIFGGGLVVSHYSTAYFAIPTLLAGASAMSLARPWRWQGARQARRPWQGILDPNFILLLAVLALFWYIYVSAESLTFEDAVRTMSRIGENLRGEFLNPAASEGLGLVTEDLTPWREVTRNFNFGFQFMMLAGVAAALAGGRRDQRLSELAVLAVPALLVNGASILVPHFAGSLHLDRVYMLTLVFLAPFAVVGGQVVMIGVGRGLKALGRGVSPKPVLGEAPPPVPWLLSPLAAALAVFLLLGSGFVYEVAGDRPNAVPLSRAWIVAKGSVEEKAAFSAAYPAEEDFAGARWLADHRQDGRLVYGDLAGRAYVLGEWIAPADSLSLYPDSELEGDAYVFLRSLNVRDGVLSGPYEGWTYEEGTSWWPLGVLEPQLRVTNIIYDNGGSRIHLVNGEQGPVYGAAWAAQAD